LSDLRRLAWFEYSFYAERAPPQKNFPATPLRYIIHSIDIPCSPSRKYFLSQTGISLLKRAALRAMLQTPCGSAITLEQSTYAGVFLTQIKSTRCISFWKKLQKRVAIENLFEHRTKETSESGKD